MKKALKYMGLFIFGFIAFPIVLFLNWKNKDKDYKNYLIASGIGFAFFLINGLFGEDTETDTNVTDNTEQVEEASTEVLKQEEDDGDEAQVDETTTEEPEQQEQIEENTEEELEKTVEKESEENSTEDDVPREHQNALKSAQDYVDIMHFSKAKLYDQLTAEYGEGYPAEAAEYAIENVVVDYNEEALEAAQNYQETMPMSDQRLFDQLTSEYGEQFTEKQARYAIDNLD